MGRVMALLYGIIAYFVFFFVFLYAIGFVTGLVVPKTIDGGMAGPVAEAIVIDLVLMSSFALALLFWQWRPIAGSVWQIGEGPIATALTALGLFGWLIVLTSTFLINHFELFGLHQIACNLVGRPMPEPHFRTPLY